jgi:hypothetical protein
MDTSGLFNFPLAKKIPQTATLICIETKEGTSKRDIRVSLGGFVSASPGKSSYSTLES